MDLEQEFNFAMELLEEVLEDRSVPKNIRKAAEEAKEKIRDRTTVSFSNAIYILDDISKDINIPPHTRTTIWEIISKLEGIKEKLKD